VKQFYVVAINDDQRIAGYHDGCLFFVKKGSSRGRSDDLLHT